MTQEEIDLMKGADGIYILGHQWAETFTQVVVVLSGELHILALGSKLDERAEEWPVEMSLVAGPLTVQNQRALNENAQQVAELVEYLRHDLSVWHERALAAEAKLQLQTP